MRLPYGRAPHRAGFTLGSLRGLLFEPAPLGSAVLKPCFHLSLSELQTLGQSLTLWRGQIFL